MKHVNELRSNLRQLLDCPVTVTYGKPTAGDAEIKIVANLDNVEDVLRKLLGGSILMNATQATDERMTAYCTEKTAAPPLDVTEITPLKGRTIEKAIKSGDTVSLVLSGGGNADITMGAFGRLTVQYSQYIEETF